MPGVPNGTACQVEEELHAEHHGPELQRTGRWAQLLYTGTCSTNVWWRHSGELSCWFEQWVICKLLLALLYVWPPLCLFFCQGVLNPEGDYFLTLSVWMVTKSKFRLMRELRCDNRSSTSKGTCARTDTHTDSQKQNLKFTEIWKHFKKEKLHQTHYLGIVWLT